MEEAGRTQYNFSFENQNHWIVRVGVRVANPTQYSLLLLLHCWMLIGCVTYPDDPMILITQNIEFYKQKCR
jgi:hypothetical protein